MKYLHDFDKFINPYNEDLSYYDFIDYNCLRYCSYVHYIYFKTINGEIDSKPISIDLENLKDIILDDVFIIAFNHLDNICMEVNLYVW